MCSCTGKRYKDSSVLLWFGQAQAHENHHRHHEDEKGGIGFSTTLLFTAWPSDNKL